MLDVGLTLGHQIHCHGEAFGRVEMPGVPTAMLAAYRAASEPVYAGVARRNTSAITLP